MPTPINKTLYARVKREAIQKFDTWPSAYASAWLVKEYKRRGGKYHGRKPKDSGLQQWFSEKWVDVCYWPKRRSCGRPKASKGYAEKYPYCRPSKRVNSRTPRTVQELTPKQRKSRCQKKRRSPKRRVY